MHKEARTVLIKKHLANKKLPVRQFLLAAALAVETAVIIVLPGCAAVENASKDADKSPTLGRVDSTRFPIKNLLASGDTVAIGEIRVRLDSLCTDSLNNFMATLLVFDPLDTSNAKPLRLELSLFEVTQPFTVRGRSYSLAFSDVKSSGDTAKDEKKIELLANATAAIRINRLILSSRNSPNPFNPGTMIYFEIAKEAQVRIEIVDIIGRSMTVLFNGLAQAGARNVFFDASMLPAGTYFARIEAGSESKTLKLLLVK